MCNKVLIKILLIITNILYTFLGFSLAIVGALSIVWDKEINVSEFTGYNFKALAIFSLVTGLILILTNILGFFGAYRENEFMLKAFAFIMIFHCILLITLLILVIINDIDNTTIQHSIQTTINGTDRDKTLILQNIQFDLKCCGWNGREDYTGPKCLSSCCGEKPNENDPFERDCNKTEVQFPGCSTKISFSYSKSGMICLCVFLLFFKVILGTSAFWLTRKVE